MLKFKSFKLKADYFFLNARFMPLKLLFNRFNVFNSRNRYIVDCFRLKILTIWVLTFEK